MRYVVLAFFALAVLLCSCEKVGGPPIGPTSTPGPTPTPTTTATSPSVCQTPDSTNPNVVYVGIASGFAAASTTYGNIAGYAVVDPSGASPPPASAILIDKTATGQSITSKNVIQFANLEPSGSGLVHSAVGFPGNAFPSKPYSFPAPLPSPVGTSVSTTTTWATGLMGTPSQTICYSNEFTLAAGTYYFGDFNYYNITTFQDVLVVSP